MLEKVLLSFLLGILGMIIAILNPEVPVVLFGISAVIALIGWFFLTYRV
jgi:hypothetical protein